MHLRISILLSVLFCFISILSAQQTVIELNNPSFEDFPRHSLEPRGWVDCGFEGESAPDVHPVYPKGAWQVKKPANHGRTYLGMVVRDNDTWESISQRLSKPLIRGNCYYFSIDLSYSNVYISQSQRTKQMANYTTPVVFRIWAGSDYCHKRELLAESDPVEHQEWRTYQFKLHPRQNHNYIAFEAFYKTPILFPYNGNILVDHASKLTQIPCDEELAFIEDLPEEEEIVTPSPIKDKKEVKKKEPESMPEVKKVNPEKPERILKDLDRDKLVKGQTIKIENLYFEADTSNVKADSYLVLDEIHAFLEENSDVTVEIGGHTNGLPNHDYCNKLSTARARAVAKYLVEKGIEPQRIKTKGYGKRAPIASNRTKEGQRKNQRVEIKILSMDG